MGKTQGAVLLLGGAILGLAVPARADYAEPVKQRMARDAVHDLGFAVAPVLLRQKINSREETIRVARKLVTRVVDPTSTDVAFDAEAVNAERQRLLETLTTPLPSRFRLPSAVGKLTLLETEEGTTLTDEGVFNLRVFRDGSAFRLTNRRYDVGKNPAFRLTESEAEIEGLRIIKDLGLVPESDLAQLEFIKTQYLHFSGMAVDPGDRVVGTEVFFARKIGGIPVIGPKGSSVRVELRPGPSVRRVVVDWMPVALAPETTPAQKVVDSQRFTQRFLGYLKSTMGTEADSASVVIERKVCGYVDFGSAYTDQDVLQLGCMVVYRQAASNTPEIVMLPLAEVPVPGQGFADAAELQRLGAEVSTSQLRLQSAAPSVATAKANPSVERPEAPQPGCSVTQTRSGTSRAALAWLGLLFLGVVSKRRLQSARRLSQEQHGGTIKRMALGALAVVCSVFTAREAKAYDLITVLHHRDYVAGTCADFATTQWENYNGFVEEMWDIPTYCTFCEGDPETLYLKIYLSLQSNTELVAVQSHGRSWYNPTIAMYEAFIKDKYCNEINVAWLDSGNSSALDIILLWGCSLYSTDNYDNWCAFRNMHRSGVPISAGCYGTCVISTTGWPWYNSTWNEIGDSLADSDETVMDAWSDGHSLTSYDNPIIFLGTGWVGSDWCGWQLPQVKWGNRHNYKGPQYGYNQPWGWWDGDPEMCNYHWST
jgi:hypothetical protein